MVLNIVEPTLNSYTGHCYALVEAIVQAAPVDRIRIWAGTQSAKIWKAKGQICPYFFRPIRKIQSFFLFRRLLKEPGKILLSTAGTSDFLLLQWAACETIPLNKVYLYVHWVGAKADKASQLAKIAKNQPHIQVLCTTDSTAAFFAELGFKSAKVTYPMASENLHEDVAPEFAHLLFAGAARMDKGFDRVVDLVEELASLQSNIPFWIQVSATHQAKHEPEVTRHIERLHRSNYAHLTLMKRTLQPQDYLAMFKGAISVQPYVEAEFGDRVSGVTLDALSAGCPVVVTANTWLGRLVMKHNAGVATNDLSPKGLRTAIDAILHNYADYAQRAAKAGQLLRQEHSAAKMMAAIFENPPSIRQDAN